MVKNGLIHSEENILYEISNAQEQFDKIQSFQLTKKYNSALSNAVVYITQALKEKNATAILHYEKLFQDYDIDRTLDGEKRLFELTGIVFIQETFEKGRTSDYAQNLYNKTYSDFHRKPKHLLDSAMDKSIKARCRSLGVLASGLANETERTFYLKRQACLRFINKEHQKNINQYLGLSQENGVSL